jgi:hypothetical protein
MGIRIEEGISASKILTGKPTGRRALERPRLRCVILRQESV